MSTTARPPGRLANLWRRYLRALNEHPFRTKMVTSSAMFALGDGIAQFGIEGRTILGTVSDESSEHTEAFDPARTSRMMIYGGVIFAPIAHVWLNQLEKIHLSSKYTTLAARVGSDMLLWSPFVTALFPSSLGLLEGKSLEKVKEKVSLSWLPTCQKAAMVFGPTQVFNFAFVPAHHRLLVVQTVGLGWNTFLSFQNNANNRRLAAAQHALQEAHTPKEVAIAQLDIERLEEKVHAIQDKEGGGAVGVATRMSWS